MVVAVDKVHSISVVDQPKVVVERLQAVRVDVSVVIVISFLTVSEKVKKENAQLPKRSNSTFEAIVKEKVLGDVVLLGMVKVTLEVDFPDY